MEKYEENWKFMEASCKQISCLNGELNAAWKGRHFDTCNKLYREQYQKLQTLRDLVNSLLSNVSECMENVPVENEDHVSESSSESILVIEDVEPVYGKEAQQLNKRVILRIEEAMDHDAERISNFKNIAMEFGNGDVDGETFYDFLQGEIQKELMDEIVMDFAKLLTMEDRRLPLLKAHALSMKMEEVEESTNSYRQGATSLNNIPDATTKLNMENTSSNSMLNAQQVIEAHENLSSASMDAPVKMHGSSNTSVNSINVENSAFDKDRKAERRNSEVLEESGVPYTNEPGRTLLPELHLETLNHLIFIIHGIGQHVDFVDGEFKSWDGKSGLEGGNHAFRDLFRTCLQNQFKEIPISLELQSIEWHQDLHEPTGVDDIFDMICPEGALGIREFNKHTLMDVLYYMSPGFGQIIIDSVSKQLNSKYKIFLAEHPGWDGKVSIFAHSLGSVIAYDLLTNKAGERAKNGVLFPEINFPVENLIVAGSPIPIMTLSRGDLSIQDGNFQAGMELPRCNHFFNVFHPIDPIAYRVEPLLKPEMGSVSAVPMLSASHIRNMSFVKLHELWESVTTPLHGFTRIDHELKPRRREGMLELAYASGIHSAYWESEEVVIFTLMQVCRPVIEKLQAYTSAQRPLPTLSMERVHLSPLAKLITNNTIMLRDGCTGFYHERLALLDVERLHIFPKAEAIAVRKRGTIPLEPNAHAEYGVDHISFILKTKQTVHTFKATSTAVRDEWIREINSAISNVVEVDHTIQSMRRVSSSASIRISGSMDYFGSIKVGSLSKKGESGWLDGWKSRWVVLHSNRIDYFESAPEMSMPKQYKIVDCTISCYNQSHLFRLLTSRGTSTEFRVDKSIYPEWLEIFENMKHVTVVHCDELLEQSPSAIMILADCDRSLVGHEKVQAKVEGHTFMTDANGAQYVVFIIHVKILKQSTVVQRRFSDFKALHRRLLVTIDHDKLPRLPGSKLWNTFDPVYLKQRAVHLQGYLANLSHVCTENRALELFLEFLSDTPLTAEEEAMVETA